MLTYHLSRYAQTCQQTTLTKTLMGCGMSLREVKSFREHPLPRGAETHSQSKFQTQLNETTARFFRTDTTRILAPN